MTPADARPLFDLTLSLGDLIQAGVLIVAITAAYYGLRGQLDIFRNDLAFHAKTVDTVSTTLTIVKDQFTDVVKDVAVLATRIDAITERREHQR